MCTSQSLHWSSCYKFLLSLLNYFLFQNINLVLIWDHFNRVFKGLVAHGKETEIQYEATAYKKYIYIYNYIYMGTDREEKSR